MSRSYSKVHGGLTQPYKRSRIEKRLRVKRYRNALSRTNDDIKFSHLVYSGAEHFIFRWFRSKKYYLHNGRINK